MQLRLTYPMVRHMPHDVFIEAYAKTIYLMAERGVKMREYYTYRTFFMRKLRSGFRNVPVKPLSDKQKQDMLEWFNNTTPERGKARIEAWLKNDMYNATLSIILADRAKQRVNHGTIKEIKWTYNSKF